MCSISGDLDGWTLRARVATIITAASIAAVPLALSAQENAQACGMAVATAHLRAALALQNQEGKLVPTAEQVIARRRLNEDYCIRLARCEVREIRPTPSPELAATVLSTQFSSCLQDEEQGEKPGNGH